MTGIWQKKFGYDVYQAAYDAYEEACLMTTI